MAVVQDGAATAAGAGKPECAAVVSVSAVCTDLRWVNCAMVQAVRESPVGSARRSPTVEHYPVRDSVTAVARVVRAVQATPDFCGELSLLIGITGRTVSPCGRGDETGEADGFGIDRREQSGGAERGRLGARRDEDLGAAGPFAVSTVKADHRTLDRSSMVFARFEGGAIVTAIPPITKLPRKSDHSPRPKIKPE
jgi:hypothetical protein